MSSSNPMKTILAPIDFSPGTDFVIAHASALARALDGRLVLVHVIEPLPVASSEYDFVAASARLTADLQSETERRLGHLEKQLRGDGFVTSTFQVVGNPGRAILAQAKAVGADYVVMGSHGHGAFYELMVGSTTGRVLKEGTCPVLVVPLGRKEREAQTASAQTQTRPPKRLHSVPMSQRNASLTKNR